MTSIISMVPIYVDPFYFTAKEEQESRHRNGKEKKGNQWQVQA